MKQNTSKSKEFILLFFLILPFIEPQLFKVEADLQIVDRAFAIFKSISSLFIVLFYLRKFYFHFSKSVLLMTAVQFITLISTLYNKGSLTRYIGPALTSIVLIMLGELVLKIEWRKFLIALENILTLFFIINVFTLFFKVIGIKPFALWPSFLGIENRWIYFFLPWTVISFINSYLKHGYINFRAWTICLISTFSLVFVWSVGAFLAFITFLISFIFRSINSQKNFFVTKASTMYFIIIILNCILVFGFSSDILHYIITMVLKKSVTLSGRTFLWETVLRVLEDSPLLGMGVQSQTFDMNFFYVQSNFCEPCRVNHPHNHFLNVAYHGGIPALIIFGYLIHYVMHQVDKIKDRDFLNIIYCGSLATFVAALVDTLDFSLFYFFIPLFIFFSAYHFEKRNINWKL